MDTPDLPKALATRQDGEASVLLAHNPNQYTDASSQHVGLTLSGHTHGGQIWPLHAVVMKSNVFISGLHGDAQHGFR